MLAREVPYVIAFLALVVLAFWLVGRAADCGWLASPAHPGAFVILSSFFVAAGMVDAMQGAWLGAACYAPIAIGYGFTAWRRWQRR